MKGAEKVYEILLEFYGPQRWWPADSPFEVIVGAILTQNTNWINVEKAIINLKTRELLTPEGLREVDIDDLAAIIRPSGYFNLKARRLKAFTGFLYEHFNGNLDLMLGHNFKALRKDLLEINGIGPETSDSIMLYAGNYPIFVIDSYTIRMFSRMGLIRNNCTYNEAQDFFMGSLDEDARLFNEYHALIVIHGKKHCKKRPLCGACPLYCMDCTPDV